MRFFLLVSFLFLLNCSSYKKGEKKFQKQQYKEALLLFDKSIYRKEPQHIKAAERAVQIAQLKTQEPDKAIRYLKYIIRHSENKKEIIGAQNRIAHLYFYQRQDYEKALVAYGQLIHMEDKLTYRLQMARSFFYLQKFTQALVEAESLLGKNPSETIHFDTLLLKARILFTQNKIQESISFYEKILKVFPQRSLKGGLYIQLSSAYEKTHQYHKALAVLENWRPQAPDLKDFLDARIKRLKKRGSLSPRSL